MVPVFLCILLSQWGCVCVSVKGTASQLFLGGWHVHYTLTAGTAGVSLPIQPKNKLRQSRLSACRRWPVPSGFSLLQKKKKEEKNSPEHACEFPQYTVIPIGVLGVQRALETFNLLAFTLQLVAAKLSLGRIKCTIMWCYMEYIIKCSGLIR